MGFLWIFGRSKTRQKVYDALREMGVPARLAERGRPEEKFGSVDPLTKLVRAIGRWSGNVASGLIEIDDGPIRWVNVTWGGANADRGDGQYEYGVPDGRPDLPEVALQTAYSKSSRWFGRITGVRWEGKDGGLGIADRLANDASIRDALLALDERLKPDFQLRIDARPEHGCWIITEDRASFAFGLEGVEVDKSGPAPSKELWDCYQAIAEHLLAEWKRDVATGKS